MKKQTLKNIIAIPVTALTIILFIVMFADPLGDNKKVWQYLTDPSVYGIMWIFGYCLPVNLFGWLTWWCWKDDQSWGGKDGMDPK